MDVADQRAAGRHQHRSVAHRPMRQLLRDLKMPPPDDGEALRRVADNAETIMSVCQNGLGALGHLLAHSAPVIEDGSVGADSIEALGWLMSELGDLAAHCMVLAAECSQGAAQMSAVSDQAPSCAVEAGKE